MNMCLFECGHLFLEYKEELLDQNAEPFKKPEGKGNVIPKMKPDKGNV